MRVACIQPKVHQVRTRCYFEIENILKNLIEKHNDCEIICLPEKWVPFSKGYSQNFQEQRGNDYNAIKNLATEYNIKFLSGAIWEKRINSKKPAITCYFFNENGEEINDKTLLLNHDDITKDITKDITNEMEITGQKSVKMRETMKKNMKNFLQYAIKVIKHFNFKKSKSHEKRDDENINNLCAPRYGGS